MLDAGKTIDDATRLAYQQQARRIAQRCPACGERHGELSPVSPRVQRELEALWSALDDEGKR